MKVAIIPDIHQDLTRLGIILRNLKSMGITKKVFLGDWFDTFDQDANTHLETAAFLSNILNDPDCVFIIGNHDVPYAFNPSIFPCPGYTDQNKAYIKSILDIRHWSKFKLAHKVGSYWCSHAGMHPTLFRPIGLDDSELDDYITKELEYAFNCAWNNCDTPWMKWGKDRGGRTYQSFGGITWLHFSSFEPIDNVNQIFGHTNAYKPRHIYSPKSDNWCIDTKLNYFLVVDDEAVEPPKLFHFTGKEVSPNNRIHVSYGLYGDVTLKDLAKDAQWSIEQEEDIEINFI